MRGLSLWDRVRLASKALTGLFDEGAATAAHGLLGGIFRGTSGTYPERGTQELLHTFNTQPWARACALRVADRIGATTWHLYVQRRGGRVVQNAGLQKAGYAHRKARLKQLATARELQEVESHLLLDLLQSGSSMFTGQDTWWLHSIFLDLIGDAFYIKQRNALGAPEALWPIPPHWVITTPTPAAPVYRVGYRSWQLDIPQTEMLWAKQPNPVNPYWRGTGLGRALDDELETDEFAVKHRKGFFRNSAAPGMIIMPKEGGLLGAPERDRLEQWWVDKLQGFWRSYKPLFMTAPMDVKLIEQNFRDMQFSELRTQEADIISQVWGIPPEMFGRLQNSNRATITQALRIFGEVVLVPRLERMRQWLQAELVPEYDAPLILDYDSPVPDDWDFQLSVMKAQPGAFQLNEYRALASLPEDPALAHEYGSGTSGGFGAPPAAEERLSDEELLAVREILERAAARQAVRR